MLARPRLPALAFACLSLVLGSAFSQTPAPVIEDELALITPVAKTLTDPALADFVKYAKERWGITVKASALAAGTPVAYGQIVEWKGRPQVDIFWGGESALFDKLAEQNLLAKLDLPKAVMDAIPASIGKPKADVLAAMLIGGRGLGRRILPAFAVLAAATLALLGW